MSQKNVNMLNLSKTIYSSRFLMAIEGFSFPDVFFFGTRFCVMKLFFSSSVEMSWAILKCGGLKLNVSIVKIKDLGVLVDSFVDHIIRYSVRSGKCLFDFESVNHLLT